MRYTRGEAPDLKSGIDQVPSEEKKKMARLRLAVIATAMSSFFLCTSARAQCTRCCVPGFSTTLSLSPTTTEEQLPVSVTIGVTSCYSSVRVFKATVNIVPETSACTSSTEAFSVSGIIYPGQHRIFTYTLPAPRCESIYKVVMNGAVRGMLTVD